MFLHLTKIYQKAQYKLDCDEFVNLRAFLYEYTVLALLITKWKIIVHLCIVYNPAPVWSSIVLCPMCYSLPSSFILLPYIYFQRAAIQ